MGPVPLSSPLLSLSLVRWSPNVPVVPLAWLGGIMGGWSGSWDKQFNSGRGWAGDIGVSYNTSLVKVQQPTGTNIFEGSVLRGGGLGNYLSLLPSQLYVLSLLWQTQLSRH